MAFFSAVLPIYALFPEDFFNLSSENVGRLSEGKDVIKIEYPQLFRLFIRSHTFRGVPAQGGHPHKEFLYFRIQTVYCPSICPFYYPLDFLFLSIFGVRRRLETPKKHRQIFCPEPALSRSTCQFIGPSSDEIKSDLVNDDIEIRSFPGHFFGLPLSFLPLIGIFLDPYLLADFMNSRP